MASLEATMYWLFSFRFVFCCDLVAYRCTLQDQVLPYMQDTRHLRDTLWNVLEENFRLYPTEGEPVASDVFVFRGAEFLGDGISGDSAGREPVASPYPTASQVPIARHNGSSSWCADGWQKSVPAARPKGKAAPARTFLIMSTKASADERMYNTSKELEVLVKQSDNNRPLQS